MTSRDFRAALLVALWLVPGAATLAQLETPPEPVENPTTEQKRVLGKILFWDEQLSSDDTVACGTCHIPAAAGGDPRIGRHPGPDGLFSTADDTVGSPGIAARNAQNDRVTHPVFGSGLQVTPRGSPGIYTSMFAGDIFWDGRARSEFRDPQNPASIVVAAGGGLESQAVVPILSAVEMAHQSRDWAEVINKLTVVTPLARAARIPPDMAAALGGGRSYPDLFAAAFGSPAITAARIGMALAAYERTLVADGTPWDRYMGGDQAAMTPAQIQGWTSFVNDTVCDNCHVPPHFTDHQFYNIGLRPAAEDAGRQNVTQDGNDFGRFKTPSLRNVGLRKAMTHVGWVTDLEDAVAFYNARAMSTRHTQFTDAQSEVPAPNGGPTVTYALVTFFPGDDAAQSPVLDFLANALTDPRAAMEAFPFDRPLLASETLSLLSFNLAGPAWDATRADLVAGVIRSVDADIVGLQEAEPGMLGDIGSRLADVYDEVTWSGGAAREPMLLKRDRVELAASGTSASALPCNGYEAVNYAVVRSHTSAENLVVLNNFLCPPDATFPATEPGATARNEAAAVAVAEALLDGIATWQAPAIAIGDFNADDSDDAMRFLTGQGAVTYGDANAVVLADVLRGVDPASGTLAGTQWSLATRAASGITVLDAAVVDSAEALAAADKQPLLVTLAVDTTPVDINASPGAPSDSVAPGVPGSFRTTSVSDSMIGLTWAASGDNVGLSHYRLLRNGNLLATMTSPGYTDQDVTTGTTYNYAVVAVDQAGNKSGAATLSARAGSVSPPPPPSGGSSGGGQLAPSFLAVLLLLYVFRVFAMPRPVAAPPPPQGTGGYSPNR